MDFKSCIGCGISKPLDEFPLARRNRDGHYHLCTDCRVAERRAHYARRTSHIKARTRRYYEENKVIVVQKQIEYAKKNWEQVNINKARWRHNNKEKHVATNVAWNKAHPEKARAHQLRYCTPKWANEFFIQEIYRLARLRTKVTGLEWHVDHIIPVRGRGVCGLHVENNLQVIPAIINRKKYNKMPPTLTDGGRFG